MLLPALSSLAFALVELGRREESQPLVDELVPGFGVAGLPAPRASVELALVAEQLGRGDEVRDVLERRRGETPCAAAWAVVRGDLDRAADLLLGEIGSLPDQAYTRLRAAERLLSAGRRAEADDRLEKALAFYRSVGATRYIDNATALRATPP